MKTRLDFVTNSSSSSFIAVFARISDKSKAQPIIEKYDYEVYTGEELLIAMGNRIWSKLFEWDWAGVDLTPSEEYVQKNITSEFIFFSDNEDIDESDGEPNYDIDTDDFSEETMKAIDAVNKENGFTDIKSGFGAGRDG